jgi:hypothetical protein
MVTMAPWLADSLVDLASREGHLLLLEGVVHAQHLHRHRQQTRLILRITRITRVSLEQWVTACVSESMKRDQSSPSSLAAPATPGNHKDNTCLSECTDVRKGVRPNGTDDAPIWH